MKAIDNTVGRGLRLRQGAVWRDHDLNLEIGYLTPPVGLNLVVAMSAFKQPFGVLVRAAAPFIFIILGCLAIVIWQPWIAMYLVNGKS